MRQGQGRRAVSATDLEPALAQEEMAIERLEERWLGLGLSTAPADRPAAEGAIGDLYRAAALGPPGQLLWVPSPFQGAAAAMMAEFLSPWMPARVRGAEWGREMVRTDGKLAGMIRQAIARHGADGAWDALGHDVWTAKQGGIPTEDVWGFTIPDWGPIRVGLGHRFGAEDGARPAERLVRMHGRLRGGPIASIMGALGGAIDRHLWVAQGHLQRGQHDAAGAAVGEYLLARLGVRLPILDALVRLAASCGWWWPYRGTAILSERPRRLALDARGRLHAEDGPALEYPDGWGVYAWHGQEVPERLILRPETITVAEVLGEANLEMRRLMLERMGYTRFILESGARPVQADETGTLYRIELPRQEPLVLVHVTNATPEPDGSRRRYFLRVPPRMQRARQAVAWTFGLTERQYAPARET